MDEPDASADAFAVFPAPDVVAVVRTGAVPEIAPALLRDDLTPIHDDDDRLVDWVLVFDSTHADAPSVAEFWAWRRRWEARWAVGDVESLASLSALAETVAHGVSDLGSLLDDLVVDPERSVPMSPGRAERIVGDIADLEVALDVVGGTALAIVDESAAGAGRRRYLRGDDRRRVVAASPALSVILELPPALFLEGVVVGERFGPVERVDLTGEPVTVSSGGDELALVPAAARPLAWLLPMSLRWHVETVAAIDAWRPVLDGLREAVSAAVGGSVVFTTGVPIR